MEEAKRLFTPPRSTMHLMIYYAVIYILTSDVGNQQSTDSHVPEAHYMPVA